MSFTKYSAKLPAFNRWTEATQKSGESEWSNYRAYSFRVDHLLMALEILCPEFVVKDSFVLRKNNIPDDWEKFLSDSREANWSSSDIEYVLNHLHIADCFPNDPDLAQIDMDVYRFLAKTVAEMWGYQLRSLFPDKNFDIWVGNMDDDPEVSVMVK